MWFLANRSAYPARSQADSLLRLYTQSAWRGREGAERKEREKEGREEKKGERGEEERKEMERKDNFPVLPRVASQVNTDSE